MKKLFATLLVLVVFLSGCGQAATPPPPQPVGTITPIVLPTETAQPSSTPTETPVPAPTATETLAPTATPAYPPEGRGPSGFAADVNPLTGMQVQDAGLLTRRPIVIKVENLPREHRPQWGLSLADIVYEYYTEFGATRFAAIYYGNNAERVGPIRSGRFFDTGIVQMYKAVFVYGSAYEAVRNRYASSDFSNRLILETPNSCPAVCRFEPNGQNLLVANTTALMEYLKQRGVDNSRQNLDGMFFQSQPPAGGEPTNQIFVRYSGAIYNRWDYNLGSGRYLRFVDADNDVNRNNEKYIQLTDRLNNQPVAAENVVTLCVPHQYVVKNDTEEVLDILTDNRIGSYYGCDGQQYMGGTGAAYVARDGKIYPVTWKRATASSVLTLYNADGSLFPLKPGQTWFEVIGASSGVKKQDDGSWRFNHIMAP